MYEQTWQEFILKDSSCGIPSMGLVQMKNCDLKYTSLCFAPPFHITPQGEILFYLQEKVDPVCIWGSIN